MSDDVKQVMDNVHKLITVSINMIKKTIKTLANMRPEWKT